MSRGWRVKKSKKQFSKSYHLAKYRNVLNLNLGHSAWEFLTELGNFSEL